MTSSRTPRPAPDYRLARLDEEILLYHPTKTKTLHLDKTASLIWRLCDGRRTVSEITEMLQEAFPDAAATIGDDVKATLRDLETEGAVEFV